jgi:uncharacterized membrane protein
LLGASGSVAYLIITLALLMVSALTYFSFSSFNLEDKTILFLTIPISIIASVSTFIGDYFIKRGLQALQTQMVTDSGSSIGNVTAIFDWTRMMNIWLLVALIIIIYNLPSIIFMLPKKAPQQQLQ